MKLLKTLWAAMAVGLLLPTVFAADLKINMLPSASSMAFTDLTLCDQSGVTRVCTGTQVAAMVQANLPNITGSGNVVFSNGPTLVSPVLGAATASSLALSGGLTANITGLTQCVHANSAGLLSGTGVDCGAGSGGSSAFNALTGGTNTTAAMLVGSGASLTPTGSGAITATSIASLTGVPPIGNQTILGNGSGTSATPVALTLGGNLVATPSGLTTSQQINAQTGTTYTVLSTDAGKLLTVSNVGAVAVSLPQAGTTGFASGFSFDVQNKGAGTATFTPITSTVNGASTLSIPQNQGCTVTSDGTNYQVSACTALVTGGGGGGSSAFNAITSGTNTTSAMVVGSGASLAPTGSGTITATAITALTSIPSISTQTVLGNGSGSSISPVALTLAGNLVATASTLGTSQSINAQTGTSYAMVAGDAGKLVTFSNAAAVAVSLSQANTTGFTSGFAFDVENKGAGTVTITPTTSTINAGTTLAIAQNTGCSVTSDGTNYQVSACTAVAPSGGGGGGNVSTSGSPTSGQLASFTSSTAITGTAIGSNTLVGNTGSGIAAISVSAFRLALLQANTKFTLTPTGCTPSSTTGGATAGLITLASGPCTSIVITMNGATGLTAANGWTCDVGDRTSSTIPAWHETSSATTTATIPIPAAAGATDVLSFSCTGF